MYKFLKELTFPIRRWLYSLRGKIPRGGKYICVAYDMVGESPDHWPVIPDLLDEESVVVSVGIGRDISFDKSISRRFGCIVQMFDPTPEAVRYLKEQDLPTKLHGHEIGLSAFDGTSKFQCSSDDGTMYRISQESGGEQVELEVRRLGTIMKLLGHDRVDLLKIDIEGAEYEVIEEITRNGPLPRQLLVEYHHRFFDRGVDKTNQSIKMLMSVGYQVFYTSRYRQEFGLILTK